MTLHYSIVFVLLMTEMFAFLLLVAPLPARLSQAVMNFIKTSPIIQNFRVSLRYTFIFVLILFIDSVNRVWRVQEEILQAKNRQVTTGISDRDDYLARKFYAQRNLYLCGFTLFLSFILIRTFNLRESLDAASTASTSDAQLRAELKQKDAQIEAMKKQSEGLSKEYNRVSDEVNKSIPLEDKKTR